MQRIRPESVIRLLNAKLMAELEVHPVRKDMELVVQSIVPVIKSTQTKLSIS